MPDWLRIYVRLSAPIPEIGQIAGYRFILVPGQSQGHPMRCFIRATSPTAASKETKLNNEESCGTTVIIPRRPVESPNVLPSEFTSTSTKSPLFNNLT